MSGEADANATVDVAIVGAGPAGLAAADAMRGSGLRIVLVDEQPRAGGQILRQPPSGFAVRGWLSGKLYDRVKRQLRAVEDCDAFEWRFGTIVLGIAGRSPYRATPGAGFELWLRSPDGFGVLGTRVVLLACGCYERPLPFPGWTLPGVMGAGAIQAFLKSQQFVAGDRFLLAGHHPLQLVVADQLLDAGAQVTGIVFTQRASRALEVLKAPVTMSLYGRQLAETGRILGRLRRARVPVLFGSTVVSAEGRDCVEGAVIAPLGKDARIDRKRERRFDCDRIGTCHGFLVSSELARQAGARVTLKEHEGGWLVEHDRWFQSSVPGLFAAGEITGLAGADAALERGRIAGIGIRRHLGRIGDAASGYLARAPRLRLAHRNAFARTLNRLSRPPEGLVEQVVTPDTVLCRCESIAFGSVRDELSKHPHVATADAAKLLTRAGMGMCQGRFCAHHLARVLARERRLPVEDVGTFRSRIPVKPVVLGEVTAREQPAAGEADQEPANS